MNAADLQKLLNEATKGPWRLEQGTTLIWGACIPEDASSRGMGYPISECRITAISSWAKGPDADAGEANARLIALSPDLARRVIAAEKLAEALRVVCQHGRIDDSESRMNMCGAALAEWDATQ